MCIYCLCNIVYHEQDDDTAAYECVIKRNIFAKHFVKCLLNYLS